MIHFIDIETGNIFDGHQPYCFWFDEGQSVGLNYVKQICFLSDKKEVKVRPSGIFKLLNLNPNSKAGLMAQETTTINDFEYKNLEDLVVTTPEYSSFGYVQRGLCVHMIYVLASSQDAGQFQEPLVIDGEEFLVGADFYNENELLKSNLENIGFEVPDTIQKAIYEQDIKEESRNNILLNRKYKELLIEYKNILMNKGSYNSLVNSLNWFEYGDLVKLQEYWKVPEKDVYLRSDLTNFLTESMRDMLNYNIKTTYIGLYLALNKIKYDENGHLIYEDIPSKKTTVGGVDLFSARLNRGLQKENARANRLFQVGASNVYVQDDNLSENAKNIGGETGAGSNWRRLGDLTILPEPIPQLEYISAMYSKEELALKMALLGNFFATYFMPIHLDLIHSTIENIVFTNTIKMIDFNNRSRIDYVHDTQSFYANLDSSKLYYLDNIRTGVDYYTDFANRDLEGKNYGDVEILGVEYLGDVKIVSPDGVNESFLPVLYSQIFSGIGCVVPVEFEIPVPDGDPNIVIQKIKLTKEYLGDSGVESDFSGDKKELDLVIQPMGQYFRFKFNLLFTQAKTYSFGIELVLNNGFTYSKRFNDIRILDNTNQDINIYKVKKLDLDEINQVLDGGAPSWNLFAFTTLPESNEHYRQYITTSNTPLKTGAGHTRVYRQKLYEFSNFEEFSNHFGEYGGGDMVEYMNYVREQLIGQFDNTGDYYYDLTIRHDAYSDKDDRVFFDKDSKIIIHLIVINKHFVIDETEVVLKDYTQVPYVVEKNGMRWESNFRIIQNNSGVFVEDYTSNIDGARFEPIDGGFIFKCGDLSFIMNPEKRDIQDNITHKDTFEYYSFSDRGLTITSNQEYFRYDNGSFEVHHIAGMSVISKDLFLPQFHKLVELDGYIVSQDDVLCVIPQFSYTINSSQKPVWIFENDSTHETIEVVATNPQAHGTSILGPYISKFEQKQLDPGYYSIKFHYKLQDTEMVVEKNSCFLLK